MAKFILFNENTIRPWQAMENAQVMVSNRNGKDCQIFCRADEVQLGDNVWEHNIVQTMQTLDKPHADAKHHYGPLL